MSTVREPFLHPTRRVYYRRVTIPKNLRQYLKGRIEVWRSLKTADPERTRDVCDHRGRWTGSALADFHRIDWRWSPGRSRLNRRGLSGGRLPTWSSIIGGETSQIVAVDNRTFSSRAGGKNAGSSGDYCRIADAYGIRVGTIDSSKPTLFRCRSSIFWEVEVVFFQLIGSKILFLTS